LSHLSSIKERVEVRSESGLWTGTEPCPRLDAELLLGSQETKDGYTGYI